jgi:hypothetical protein
VNDTPEMYLIVFIASGVSVFVKTVQSSNIIHKRLWFIPPVSILMQLLDAFLVTVYVKSGVSLLVIVAGIASGLGSVGAVIIYDKVFGERAMNNE